MSKISNVRVWKDFYGSGQVIALYARSQRLQLPERSIFDIVAADLAQARLLDLGVGAGRTTHELAPRCRSYVGADYAEPMIDACRHMFADQMNGRDMQFEVADARAMSFVDGGFDIVFFSYNGIDVVGQGARDQVLAECRRVLRPGGWFIYSSHNLNWMDGLRHVRWDGLRDYIHGLRFWRSMQRMNAALWPIKDRSHVEFADPCGGGDTYYARPLEHVRQARRHGYTDVRVFDLQGRQRVGDADICKITDPWVYFLCRG